MFEVRTKDNLEFQALEKGRLFIHDGYPYIKIEIIEEYNALNLETGNPAVINLHSQIEELRGYFQET